MPRRNPAKRSYTDDDLVTMLLAVADMAAQRNADDLAAQLRFDAEMIAGDTFDPRAGIRFDDLEGGTDDPGINHGIGRGFGVGTGQPVNVDLDTGIHFGIIPQNEVMQAWFDSAEAVYPELDPAPPVPDDEYDEYEPNEDDDAEPIGFRYNQGGYEATQDGGDADIMILQSPFFTYAQFCSPCAPGAVYLLNWLRQPVEENKGYCFGHDWFDNDEAPYPVFDVKTGQRVYPKNVIGRVSRQDLVEAILVTADLAEELGRHALAKLLRAGVR